MPVFKRDSFLQYKFEEDTLVFSFPITKIDRSILNLPLEGGYVSAVNKHVLATLVFEAMWLRHVQCQNVSRINSHLH